MVLGRKRGSFDERLGLRRQESRVRVNGRPIRRVEDLREVLRSMFLRLLKTLGLAIRRLKTFVLDFYEREEFHLNIGI